MMFFGPECRVAAEEYAGERGLESDLIDHRHFPPVELDAQVALDPGEGVVLADGQHHIVAGEELLTDDPAGRNAAVAVDVVLHQLEVHAGLSLPSSQYELPG